MSDQEQETSLRRWLRAEATDDAARAEAALTDVFGRLDVPRPRPDFAARVAARAMRAAAPRPLPRWAWWLAAAMIAVAFTAPLRIPVAVGVVAWMAETDSVALLADGATWASRLAGHWVAMVRTLATSTDAGWLSPVVVTLVAALSAVGGLATVAWRRLSVPGDGL